MALFCRDAVRRSLRSTVDIVTRLRDVRPRNRGSLLRHNTEASSESHPMGTERAFDGGKAAEA
jgi:hypothetical protein